MIITLIMLLAILMFLIILRVIYNMTFYYSPAKAKRNKPFHPPSFDKVADTMRAYGENLKKGICEDVSITSVDGLKLHAHYYHTADNAPVLIIAHGYKSYGLHDGTGGYKIFTERGYNVLIPDHRAHGKSEGRCISFGIKERYDFAKWAQYCADRFGEDVEIVFIGVSMGAATVMMLSDMELKGRVRGLIADCGYNSPKDIICHVMKTQFHLPPAIFYPLVRLSAFIYGGFDPNCASPEKSLKNAKYPLLVIHGEADSFVPHSMSKIVYDACASEKLYLSVPDADHGISLMVDEKAYHDAIDKFLCEIALK